MIDVRLLRSDPAAVRAATARRGDPRLLEQLDRAAALDDELRELTVAARRGPGQRQRAVEGGRPAAARRRRRGRRGQAGREPDVGRGGAAPRAGARRGVRDAAPAAARLPEPDPSRRSRRRVGRRQRRSCTARSTCPASSPSTSASRTGRPAPALGILDNERAIKISGAMFTMTRGLGATLGPGAVPAGARPQRRRLRGGAPAVARVDGHADGERPAAQVRRRRLRHRARRPVVHPDGRGAAHVDVPRRDPRRGRPAQCA